MKSNAIDQIRNTMGLTDAEVVETLKSMGYTDEHIAIMRKTDDEMTTEEKESMLHVVANKFINSLGSLSKNSETNEPSSKQIVINVVDLGSHYKPTVESDFGSGRTLSIIIDLALEILKREYIDVSSVEKQLEPLTR